MTDKNGIISPEIREILAESAQMASQANWIIADCALSVFNNYLGKRDKGEWEDITEGEVWKAVGYYAKMSPWRVQTLAGVARIIPREVRVKYSGDWAWGYFEAVSKRQGAGEIEQIFEFLDEYKDGTLTYPLPGRVLGVGEFLLVYDTHILGKSNEDLPPEPHMQGLDLSNAPVSRGLSWVGFLQPLRETKRFLLGQAGEDKPNTQRLYALIDEIEKVTPEVMRELGFRVLTGGRGS